MGLLRTKYLKAAITYRDIQRIETFPVPEPALREAVLNAIVHKDYAIGAPVQIRVHADPLKIWNPGQLPPDWTVAKLKGTHSSQPFNPNVANVFFRAGEIEAWGRGIERIFTACRAAGFPEPVIEYETTGLWVCFPFSEELVQRTAPSGTSGKTSGKTSGMRLGKTDQKIVDLMVETPDITIPELAEKLRRTERAIELQINKLKENQVIRRIGPAHGGHWEVTE